MTPARCLLATTLGVACAVLVACGGKTDHLIPAKDAATIDRQLAALQSQVEQGACAALGENAGRLAAAVDRLPKSVNVKLRNRLDQGIRHLTSIAPDACTAQNTITETTPAVTTDTDTQTETTAPTETTPAPVPTDTTPTPPPNIPTTETREDTLPDSSSDDTGGTAAP